MSQENWPCRPGLSKVNERQQIGDRQGSLRNPLHSFSERIMETALLGCQEQICESPAKAKVTVFGQCSIILPQNLA